MRNLVLVFVVMVFILSAILCFKIGERHRRRMAFLIKTSEVIQKGNCDALVNAMRHLYK